MIMWIVNVIDAREVWTGFEGFERFYLAFICISGALDIQPFRLCLNSAIRLCRHFVVLEKSLIVLQWNAVQLMK